MFWNEDIDGVEVMPAPPQATTTSPLYFQDGNPQTGRLATILKADFLNTVLEEGLNILREAGIEPDKMDNAQLARAIQYIARDYGAYEALANRLMLRNKDGRCQVEAPVHAKDATPMGWVTDLIAKNGITKWSAAATYTPLPWLVWGSDNNLYIAIAPSGPGVSGVGAKDPTTTTGYWVTLAFWLGIRPIPTAAQTFFVRTDGNDNNDGRADTPARAFASPWGAIAGIIRQQAASPHGITINIGSGVYSRQEGWEFTPSTITNGLLLFQATNPADKPTITITLGNAVNPFGGQTQFKNINVGTCVNSGINRCYALSPHGGAVIYFEGGIIFAWDLRDTKINCLCYPVNSQIYLSNDVSLRGDCANAFDGYNGYIQLGQNEGTAYNLIVDNLRCQNFAHMVDYSVLRRATKATLSIASGGAYVQRKYDVARYSQVTFAGAGVNWFPGTAAGIVDTASYGFVSA